MEFLTCKEEDLNESFLSFLEWNPLWWFMVGGVAVDRIRLYFSAAVDIDVFPEVPLLVLLKPQSLFFVQIIEKQACFNKKAVKSS